MNDPVKCPDCGLWWRTDTHRCEEKKPAAVVVKKDEDNPKLHNATATCLSCAKQGKVYFKHICGFFKTYPERYEKTDYYKKGIKDDPQYYPYKERYKWYVEGTGKHRKDSK